MPHYQLEPAADRDARQWARWRSGLKTIELEPFIFDERPISGGYNLTVQFVGRPDAMYRAWIYDIGDEWEIRSWERAVCSPAEQRWLRIRYSDLSNMAMSG